MSKHTAKGLKLKIYLLTHWLKGKGIRQNALIDELNKLNLDSDRPFSTSVLSNWKHCEKSEEPNVRQVEIIEKYVSELGLNSEGLFLLEPNQFANTLGLQDSELQSCIQAFEAKCPDIPAKGMERLDALASLPQFLSLGVDPMRTDEAYEAMKGTWLFAHYAEAKPHNQVNELIDENDQGGIDGDYLRCGLISFGDMNEKGLIKTELRGVTTEWAGESFAVGRSGYVYSLLGESKERDEVAMVILRQLTGRKSDVTTGMLLSLVHFTETKPPRIGSSKCLVYRLTNDENEFLGKKDICRYYSVEEFVGAFPEAAQHLDEIDNAITRKDGVYALIH